MRARTRRSTGGRMVSAGSWARKVAGVTVAASTALAVSAVAVPAAATAAPVDTRTVASGARVDVIVRYDEAVGPGPAEAVVVRSGGSVDRRMPSVGGFVAGVPERALAALRAAPGVVAVTPDAAVRLTADTWQADKDASSMYSIAQAAGVQDVWSKVDANGKRVTGTGVGVALIDSGVAPVNGLNATGKVVNGPDLSFESTVSNLRYLDTFGHGTHMAGIIAGRDSQVGTGQETDARYFVGVAPGAHIVSLKVATADGATDVSQVIAAIDWVVQHRNDPGLNIRVLNLSFGTDSTQDARLDPLAHAVEVAWRKGIVAVVAVGNDGAAQTRVTMPAADPYVIAVGAADPVGTTGRRDDVVADFSTRGNSTRHADIFAPGRSVVSLRAQGSFIDTQFPEGLVAGDATQRLFRGSGTSQAAAVVSGAAALLVQQRPLLTPDQVKRLLMSTAAPMSSGSGDVYGAGQLDVKKASDTATPIFKQLHLTSMGIGTLEGARGSYHVADSETGAVLTGEKDIFGHDFTSGLWAPQAQLGGTWNGGTWNGNVWAGDSWTGTSWTSRTWSAATWTARTWSGTSWTARTWSDAVWTADGWSSRTWSSRTWSSRTWSSRTWSSTGWSGRTWSAARWG